VTLNYCKQSLKIHNQCTAGYKHQQADMHSTCLLFTLSTITSLFNGESDTPFIASRFIAPSTVTECASDD